MVAIVILSIILFMHQSLIATTDIIEQYAWIITREEINTTTNIQEGDTIVGLSVQTKDMALEDELLQLQVSETTSLPSKELATTTCQGYKQYNAEKTEEGIKYTYLLSDANAIQWHNKSDLHINVSTKNTNFVMLTTPYISTYNLKNKMPTYERPCIELIVKHRAVHQHYPNNATMDTVQ